MSKIRDYLTKERGGFAISFELMLATYLIVMMLLVSVFLMRTYEQDKYFAQVATATCDIAARYGGNASKAYSKQNPNGGTIQDNANWMLRQVTPARGGVTKDNTYSASITVDDYPDNNGDIKVTLIYSFSNYGMPEIMKSVGIGGTKTIQMKVPSLVQKGILTHNS